jgi:hypothetical protein
MDTALSFLRAAVDELWRLAQAYPRSALVVAAFIVLWTTIHARPRRLDSSYVREHPNEWAAAKRRLDRETPGKCCDACILWRALAAVPLVGGIFRALLKGRLQWHHWRYPDRPGEERRIHMSRLCTDVGFDHHGDADKWRRFAESIPGIGRWAWAVVKPAFLATALVSQLAVTLVVLGGFAAGLWFGIPFLADHVSIH